jgi:hypothetical protein
LIPLPALKLKLHSPFIREETFMVGQTALLDFLEGMKATYVDLHLYAKGHPFTLQEVDAALQEAEAAEAVCLNIMRQYAASE